jgi:hypothetical protein
MQYWAWKGDFTMRITRALAYCLLAVGLSFFGSAGLPKAAEAPSDLPRLWQIVWANDVSIERLRSLKIAASMHSSSV